MNRTPVKSSNIKSVGHDAARQILEVEFHSGAVHQYHGVPAHKHAALLKARSIGSHFHANIRNKHKSTGVQ